MRTIDLDCPPGGIRPGDLIGGVLEGTDLVAGEPVATFFGNWTWEFDVADNVWEEKIQPVIKPRIVALYNEGLIRYGTW
jgi:hypothetical protein